MTALRRWAFPMLTLAALLLAARPSTAQDTEPVRVVPAAIDLGEWPAGGRTDAGAWLINTGDRPVRITDAASDGDRLVLAGFRPVTLPPRGAREVAVSIVAPPQAGDATTGRITFRADDHPPITLTVTVLAVHPDLRLPPPSAASWSDSPLRAAPPAVDLGLAAPGERAAGAVWIVNPTDRPLTIVAAKGSCGCLEIPEVTSLTIDPHRAAAVPMTMLALNDVGQEQTKHATFLLDTDEPLSVSVTLRVVEPRLARVRRFLAARDREDATAMRVLLAVESPIWIGTRDDSGIARAADGRAPWAEWDRLLNTERTYDELRMDGDAVTLRVTETNDIDRLLDRPPRARRATYRFTADDEIAGVLYEPLPAPAGADQNFAAFIAWARRHRPETLVAIYPDGAMLRSAASAQRWRLLLLAWRKATRE